MEEMNKVNIENEVTEMEYLVNQEPAVLENQHDSYIDTLEDEPTGSGKFLIGGLAVVAAVAGGVALYKFTKKKFNQIVEARVDERMMEEMMKREDEYDDNDFIEVEPEDEEDEAK